MVSEYEKNVLLKKILAKIKIFFIIFKEIQKKVLTLPKN
jgi:hypothetical protein